MADALKTPANRHNFIMIHMAANLTVDLLAPRLDGCMMGCKESVAGFFSTSAISSNQKVQFAYKGGY